MMIRRRAHRLFNKVVSTVSYEQWITHGKCQRIEANECTRASQRSKLYQCYVTMLPKHADGLADNESVLCIIPVTYI